MTKLGTVKFSGKSGTRYAFAAYPLETVFAEEMSGVYVLTRRRQGKAKAFVHKRISTGQSDDLRQPLGGDEQALAAKGANCICVHAEKDQAARQMIELDLARELPAVGGG